MSRISRLFSSAGRRVLIVGAAVLAAFGVAAAVTTVYVVPKPVGALRIRSAVPSAPEFEYVNRVSRSPREWIEAVCEVPPSSLPDYARLPHATDTASCRSSSGNGSSVSLLIARFPTEFLLQLDLGNEGYAYYAFAYDAGTLLTIATTSPASMTDAHGFGVSPALEPLERFGFNVYGGPGLP